MNVEPKAGCRSAAYRIDFPETVGGYPVDVRGTRRTSEKIRLSDPTRYASMASAIPPELRPPVFPFERDFSGTPASPLSAMIEAHGPIKEQINYKAPDEPLAAVTDKFTITCHASPDAGWPTLGPFLAKTAKTLTIGMYDFTAAHILDAVKARSPRSWRGKLQAQSRS